MLGKKSCSGDCRFNHTKVKPAANRWRQKTTSSSGCCSPKWLKSDLSVIDVLVSQEGAGMSLSKPQVEVVESAERRAHVLPLH